MTCVRVWRELAKGVERLPAKLANILTKDRVRRGLRGAPIVILVVLAIGGIPGARWRMPVYEAPPVPSDSRVNNGLVNVTVHAIDEGSPASPAIGGATVRALSIMGDRAYLSDVRGTDRNGLAVLSNLPHAQTWILVDAHGRARGSAQLAVDASPRTIRIDLPPEHSIDVAVKNDLGEPVVGAEIEVTASADPLPVGSLAGADGRAHVARLSAGPWHITARVPGYEEANGRANHDGDESVLVIRKLGAIAAHVVGVDGHPAKGARVAIAGSALWPSRMATADDQGDVKMAGLGAGTYVLRATRDDTVSPIDFDVALARGDEKQVTLHLAQGRFVGVRVTDGDGTDAPGIGSARVTLAEGGLSPFPLEATTDATGRARLGPISPSGATISARADGFVPRGGVAIAEPVPKESRVALLRAGVLTGRVLDTRGEPIDGATIEIAGTDPTGGPIFEDPRRSRFQAAHFDAMLAGPVPLVAAGELGVVPGPVPPIPNGWSSRALTRTPSNATAGSFESEPWVTRADGTFRASPASPGRIRAIVHHPQYVAAVSELVTIAPGGEANVDVVMHEGGELEGRVVDVHERPIEGARVDVSGTTGTLEKTTRTASDGSFAFAALPEMVTLRASDVDSDQPDVRMIIAIPDGGRKQVTIVLPEPREALPVTVVDDRGWPVDAVQLTASAVSADQPLRVTAFTDAQGEASLKRARGLPLRIEVRAPAHAPRVVTTSGVEESLHIELAPAESATGAVVKERGGDAIVGASVTLYTDVGVKRVRTDARGTFALSELAPGNARLTVRASGFAPLTKSIAIPDSGGQRPFAVAPIELAEEATVEGDVVDETGSPIAGARVAKDAVPTWLPVGSNPMPMAITDAHGRFTLRELPEGILTLEAYAPGLGRARVTDVKVSAGDVTDGVHIEIAPGHDDSAAERDLVASGGVAVTLGETGAPTAVVIVSVIEGSEAERAGLMAGDVLLSVDGVAVRTMVDARSRLSGSIADDVVVTVRRADRTLALRVAREAIHR